MKAAVFLALIVLSSASARPKKLFHEHVEDFIGVILAEKGLDFERLLRDYAEYEDISTSMIYLKTTNFRDLMHEMESLPEFKAVITFLAKDNIEITYYLDYVNDLIDVNNIPRKIRHGLTGKHLNSFLGDFINLLPKEKLQHLFEQKKVKHQEFSVAIENLKSKKWDHVYSALWASDTFKNEVKTLAENGIDVHLIIEQVKAIFGQN